MTGYNDGDSFLPSMSINLVMATFLGIAGFKLVRSVTRVRSVALVDCCGPSSAPPGPGEGAGQKGRAVGRLTTRWSHVNTNGEDYPSIGGWISLPHNRCHALATR